MTRSTHYRRPGDRHVGGGDRALLAGSPGSERALKQVADGDTRGVEDAVREAFVSALGTSLKISAAVVLLGAIAALVLLRRSQASDAGPVEQPVGAVTPRPARSRAPAFLSD